MATDLGYRYDRSGDRVSTEPDPPAAPPPVPPAPRDPNRCSNRRRYATDGTCCPQHDTIPTPAAGITAEDLVRAHSLLTGARARLYLD
jgi:hypothetical protein